MACGDFQWFMKLFSQNRWIQALAYLFCISVFLVQLFKLLPTYFAPTMTYTEVTNVQLKDIDFPLDFEICVKPLLNSTALQEFGYPTPYHYIVGSNSTTNNTSIGWGGYSNNSGALISAKEVLITARLNVTTNILTEVHIDRPGGNAVENLVDKVTLDKINWVYECHTLNLSNVADFNSMEALSIFFNLTDDILLGNNISVELRVKGKTLKSQRDIQEHQLYASGDDLTIDDVKLNQFSSYIMRIKKNVFVEEDRTKNCRNYPNLDFESYKDCDFRYMRNKVKEMNLMPPWLTDDLENVTTEPVKSTSHILYQLQRFIMGLETSDCLLPCTQSQKK